MTTIYDVPQGELVEKTAEKLKTVGSIKPPAWSVFVKTGMSREKPPIKDDWWYTRSASILIQIYKKGPIGVAKLRTYYGSKKNRGSAPEKFYKASGNIVRKALQQLEAAGFAKQVDKQGYKGRVLTKEGKMFIESASQETKAAGPKQKAPKPAPAEKPTAPKKAPAKPKQE